MITVRPAELEDIEFLAGGNERMAMETENLQLDEQRVRAGVRAVFEGAGHGFYLVAELDGIRVGQLMVTYEWSDWRNGVFLWIQSVYTLPDYRGRGVFRALYAAVQAITHEREDVCGLRLYVEADNEAAQETYRRCGMNETAYRLFEVDHIVKR